MYGIIIGLSLISSTVSQYPLRGSLKADLVFDDNNERFDVDAIKAAMGSKYQQREAPYRRKLEDGVLKKLAERIRNYHAEIEDSIPKKGHKVNIEGLRDEFNIKTNSKNKNTEIEDKLMNRLVDVASNSLKDQDIDNYVENRGNSFSDVKDDYNKKLKILVEQEVNTNRRASQIVNELHQGFRRSGAEVPVIGNPVEDLLMHYAFPMKVKLQGFINVPNDIKK